MRDGVYALSGAVGAIGVGFHTYNVLRRPGGTELAERLLRRADWGAGRPDPGRAPSGSRPTRLAQDDRPDRLKLFGVPVGRALSAFTAFGLMGTVSEAGLMHFRGSFQNPFMWLPVSLPPIAAALTAKAAIEPAGKRHWQA